MTFVAPSTLDSTTHRISPPRPDPSPFDFRTTKGSYTYPATTPERENSGTISYYFITAEADTPVSLDKPEKIDRTAWLQQAQAYLQSLSEEERAWLHLTELSLRDVWGDEDDIWDEI